MKEVELAHLHLIVCSFILHSCSVTPHGKLFSPRTDSTSLSSLTRFSNFLHHRNLLPPLVIAGDVSESHVPALTTAQKTPPDQKLRVFSSTEISKEYLQSKEDGVVQVIGKKLRVLKPRNTKITSVVHFVGGIFVGAAPQLTYRLFLERLSDSLLNPTVAAMDPKTLIKYFRSPDYQQQWTFIDACLWIIIVLFQILQAIRAIGPTHGLKIASGVLGIVRAFIQVGREVKCADWSSRLFTQTTYCCVRLVVTVGPSVGLFVVAVIRIDSTPLLFTVCLILEPTTKLVFEGVLKEYKKISEGERALRSAINEALRSQDVYLRAAVEEAVRVSVGSETVVPPMVEQVIQSVILSALRISKDRAEVAIAERDTRAERADDERIALAELASLAEMVARVEREVSDLNDRYEELKWEWAFLKREICLGQEIFWAPMVSLQAEPSEPPQATESIGEFSASAEPVAKESLPVLPREPPDLGSGASEPKRRGD